PLGDQLQMNFGVEAPSSEIDASTAPGAFTASSSTPDFTANVRWENAKRGHIQVSGVLRDISAHGGAAVGDQSVVGYGINLCSSLNIFARDSIQEQVIYGQGIFRYFNDDFINNDAAF